MSTGVNIVPNTDSPLPDFGSNVSGNLNEHDVPSADSSVGRSRQGGNTGYLGVVGTGPFLSCPTMNSDFKLNLNADSRLAVP